MASNFPPKKNVAFTLYFFIHKNDGTIIANPTLTGSNVHVDGNVTQITDSTLAVVDAVTGLCSIVLAQATMNGDQIDGTITSSSAGAVVEKFKLMTAAQTLDELDAIVDSILEDTGALDTRLTAARAGYIDKLNVSGALAHSDAAATYKADVSGLATAATALNNTVWTNAKAAFIDAAISSIATAIVDASPVNVTLDATYGYTLVTGAYISGAIADTFTANGQYLVLAPDGTNVLDAEVRFDIGETRPSTLDLRGRLLAVNPGAAAQYAEIYLWDYDTAAWELVSNAATRLNHSTTDSDFMYTLFDRNNEAGIVRVRFVSSRINASDRLYLDHVFSTVVALGPTVGDIAGGVWSFDIKNRQLDGSHTSAAYFLSRTMPDWGRVTAVDGATVTFDRIRSVNSLYDGRVIQFHRGGSFDYIFARVVSQTGQTLTLDRDVEALGVALDLLWHAYILPEAASTEPPTAAAVAAASAAAVWSDEIVYDAGTKGDTLDALDVSAIPASVWTYTTRTLTSAGTPEGWVIINEDTLDIAGVALGPLDAADILIEARNEAESLINSTRSEGDYGFELALPPSATYTLQARRVGFTYDERTVVIP